MVVEATPLLPPTSLYTMATYYGYTITLYDVASGKQITGQLRSDALLTLRYDEATLAKRGVGEDQIRPASFANNLWQPADTFVVNTQSNKVTSRRARWGHGRSCGHKVPARSICQCSCASTMDFSPY